MPRSIRTPHTSAPPVSRPGCRCGHFAAVFRPHAAFGSAQRGRAARELWRGRHGRGRSPGDCGSSECQIAVRRRCRCPAGRKGEGPLPRRCGLSRLAGDARQGGQEPRQRQRRDARPHARPDGDERLAARSGRLWPEAADARHLRVAAAGGSGPREEARHPDGHSASLEHRISHSGAGRAGRRDRPGQGSPHLEQQEVGRSRPAADADRFAARQPRLGRLGGRVRRAAVHRRRLLSPRQLAKAARLRDGHVRRHGLPHLRPGVRGFGPHRAALGSQRGAQAERLQLGQRRDRALYAFRARSSRRARR